MIKTRLNYLNKNNSESSINDAGSEIFRMENVTKRFGGLKALTDVNLSIRQNEIMGLIGPNGAGKSTLFNVATSIYKPDSGNIFLRDENITGKYPHHICWMGISRTFQLAKTFLSMTALENVLVGAIYGRKLRTGNARQQAMEALELVGLESKENIKTSQMTLSDRRLLEVARALVSGPLLMLLDEPMAGLNPSEIKNMLRVIEKAHKERNIAILWVEHKVEAIFRLCERIIVLEYGQKIAEGKPEEIAQNNDVIEAYLGKPTS